MSELAYILVNASVMPFWVLMVVAPGSQITKRITATPLVPALYALVYSALLVPSLLFPAEGGGMHSLDALRIGFDRDVVLLLAWVHYLSFDMATGMWVYRDARRLKLSWAAVGPCLVFTLMLGPFGFGAYTLLRWFRAGATAWES